MAATATLLSRTVGRSRCGIIGREFWGEGILMSAVARVFSEHRIAVSRVFGFGFLAALLLTGSRWQGTIVADLMFLVGLMLAAVGMVGRIWCLVYSSGYKSSQLVTVGPYVIS